jgi:ABC-type multidrug transport system fused ATPase/permease subunit
MEVRDDAARDAPRVTQVLVRLFAPHWRDLLGMGVLATLAAFVPMVTAEINRAVVDRFNEQGAVVGLASLWCVVVLGAALFAAASAWTSFRVGHAIATGLTRAVFTHLVRQSLRYHERNRLAAAHTLIGRVMQQLREGF